jgi:hypothetical protein
VKVTSIGCDRTFCFFCDRGISWFPHELCCTLYSGAAELAVAGGACSSCLYSVLPSFSYEIVIYFIPPPTEASEMREKGAQPLFCYVREHGTRWEGDVICNHLFSLRLLCMHAHSHINNVVTYTAMCTVAPTFTEREYFQRRLK